MAQSLLCTPPLELLAELELELELLELELTVVVVVVVVAVGVVVSSGSGDGLTMIPSSTLSYLLVWTTLDAVKF